MEGVGIFPYQLEMQTELYSSEKTTQGQSNKIVQQYLWTARSYVTHNLQVFEDFYDVF